MQILQQVKRHPNLQETFDLVYEQSQLNKLLIALKTPGSFAKWEDQTIIHITDEAIFENIITDIFFTKKYGFRKSTRKPLYSHPLLKKSSPKQLWKIVLIQWSTKEFMKKHFIMKLYNFILGQSDEVVRWSKDGEKIIVNDLQRFRLKVQKDKQINFSSDTYTQRVKCQMRLFFFDYRLLQDGLQIKHLFIRKNSSIYMWTIAILMKREQIKIAKVKGKSEYQTKQRKLRKKKVNYEYESQLKMQDTNVLSDYHSSFQGEEEEEKLFKKSIASQIIQSQVTNLSYDFIYSKKQKQRRQKKAALTPITLFAEEVLLNLDQMSLIIGRMKNIEKKIDIFTISTINSLMGDMISELQRLRQEQLQLYS